MPPPSTRTSGNVRSSFGPVAAGCCELGAAAWSTSIGELLQMRSEAHPLIDSRLLHSLDARTHKRRSPIGNSIERRFDNVATNSNGLAANTSSLHSRAPLGYQ